MMTARTLLEQPRTHAVRWTAAAVLVLGAHVGAAALGLMQWPEEAEDASAGAVIIEMVPAPPTPVDSPDVAHGPRAEEAALAPQAAKPVEEVVDKETPPVDPSPAPEPEVALPKPVEAKKEQEEVPKEEVPQQQSPEQASAAPLTTAPPRVDAVEQPQPAAPSPGAAPQVSRQVMVSWERSLVSHLNRFKRYPDAARSKGSQGAVLVHFTLDRTGQVLASRVARSSGSPALDAEAVAVLQRASPLPAPPAQAGAATYDLALPIHFQIR